MDVGFSGIEADERKKIIWHWCINEHRMIESWWFEKRGKRKKGNKVKKRLFYRIKNDNKIIMPFNKPDVNKGSNIYFEEGRVLSTGVRM